MWAKLGEQSDKEGWPPARFLAALAEHEIAVLNDEQAVKWISAGTGR